MWILLLMSISAALTDVGLVLGRSGAVGAGDVGLLLGFGLYFFLRGLIFEFGALEGDAAHNSLGEFVVADVATAICAIFHITGLCSC